MATELVGYFEQTVGRVGTAVEEHIFHPLQQEGLDFVVNFHLPRIDDGHIQPRPNGMIEER